MPRLIQQDGTVEEGKYIKYRLCLHCKVIVLHSTNYDPSDSFHTCASSATVRVYEGRLPYLSKQQMDEVRSLQKDYSIAATRFEVPHHLFIRKGQLSIQPVGRTSPHPPGLITFRDGDDTWRSQWAEGRTRPQLKKAKEDAEKKTSSRSRSSAPKSKSK